MYVCICNAIKDKDVSTAVAGGAGTVASVFKSHGHRPKCGRCIRHMHDEVKAAQRQTLSIETDK